MTYISKPFIAPAIHSEQRIEFFKTKVVKDVKGNDVEIPESIGVFSKEGLLREKEDLLTRLADIDEKLKAFSE